MGRKGGGGEEGRGLMGRNALLPDSSDPMCQQLIKATN